MCNKQTIKIIFVDVDDTLFDHTSNSFTSSSIEALKTAMKNGVKVIICTSRPYYSLNFLGAIDIVPHDGYICTNGGVAVVGDKYLLKGVVREEVVRYVEKTCDEHNILLQIVPHKDMFANRGVNKYFLAFKHRWIQPIPPIRKYNGEEVSSLIMFGEEGLEQYFNKIENVYFYKFCDGGYDIYEYEYLKSHGVKAVLDYYGFSKEEALAIGDDVYDIDMFNEVKYSACMGNGNEKVKQVATYVTDTIDKNGVKKALKHFNVI